MRAVRAAVCPQRPIKAGEVEGVDFFFKTDAQFDALAASGELLDVTTVGQYRYATSLSAIDQVIKSGKHCVLELDLRTLLDQIGRDDFAPVSLRFASCARTHEHT